MRCNSFINSTKLTSVCRRLWVISLMLAFSVVSAYGQGGFSSGSTGADGAFAPTTSQTVTLPASGVFNFTTVNIPAGVTITFTRNANNTPVTILASGDVTINGTISVDGDGAGAAGIAGLGGSGGFAGGNGGANFDSFSGQGTAGDGPGGGLGNLPGLNNGGGAGYAQNGQGGTFAGQAYGASTLLPLIGGSGGGGGGANLNNRGAGGGGGGGAILIASSTSITLVSTAILSARGGGGGSLGCNQGGYGGGGSGGAIRLIANNITGNGTLRVTGGNGGSNPQCSNQPGGSNGAAGYIRVEAYSLQGFNPTATPGFSSNLPNPVQLNNGPQLQIASVAGIAAPTNPSGSFQKAPDITVPLTQTNPMPVVVNGVNVPAGTVVDVVVKPTSGTVSSAQAPLTGSGTTTATVNVNLPNGISIISAKATVTLTALNRAPFFIQGEEVDRVEITAIFGKPSELTYITKSGRRFSGQ